MRCGIVVSRYRGPVAAGAPTGGAPPAAAGGSPFFSPPADPGASARWPAPAESVFGAAPSPRPLAPPSPPAVSPFTLAPAPAAASAAVAAPAGTVYEGPAIGTDLGAGAGNALRPAASAYPTVRRSFELGQVLSDTFRLYFANLLPFVLITTVALLPPLALTFYASTQRGGLTPLLIVGLLLGGSLLAGLVCTPIATGAITYGVSQQLRGREAAITDCLAVGLRTMLPVLGIAIVQGFLVLLGSVLCIIPGIILATMYAVTVPVAIEERPGVGGSMSRSAQLTEGYRWPVFGALFILGVVQFGLNRIAQLFAGAPTGPRFVTAALVATCISSLFTVGLSATAAAVMYYRLRSAKESIDVANLASIFD